MVCIYQKSRKWKEPFCSKMIIAGNQLSILKNTIFLIMLSSYYF